MKILIAGAGIGGMTAALCLQKAGLEVRIFEQCGALQETGAGIQCGANALRVIDYLGLLAEVEAVSVAPERADFRDYQNGQVLYSAAFGERYREKFGAPYLHLYRSDLHQILVRAFCQSAGDIELNATVVRYLETDKTVTLVLADGRRVEGDCLIAADGVKSALRTQLLGETHPIFTGNAAWRGVLSAARLPKNFMDKVVSNFVGPGKHMVVYYLRKQQLINFVGVVADPNWNDAAWVRQAPWEELKAHFQGWHETVQTVIDCVDKEQCYRWALYHHRPFGNWSSDRVTLLGDAAHSTLPYMASGAALAIEDARILQRALEQTGGIKQGLVLYQRNRFKRTAKVQNDSARLGQLYHIQNRLVRKLAFKTLRYAAKHKENFLAEYDANTVQLL